MSTPTFTASSAARVAIIGAGGLGNPAGWGLVSQWSSAAPLELHIFDPDLVERSNLPRQVLFSEVDIGQSKALVLAKALTAKIRPGADICILPHEVAISETNIEELLGRAHFVIDATDSVHCKFLLNDFCVRQDIGFCYGGAVGYGAQLLTVSPKAPQGACLRCLFGDFTETDYSCLGPSCQQAGILGPVVGTLGFLQAGIARDYFAATDDSDVAPLFYRLDLRRAHAEQISPGADPQCTVCSVRARRKLLRLENKRCPTTFLLTKLALEEMAPGEPLDVRLASAESVGNVHRSVIEQNFTVLSAPREIEPGVWRMLVCR